MIFYAFAISTAADVAYPDKKIPELEGAAQQTYDDGGTYEGSFKR